jgi:MFS family permease
MDTNENQDIVPAQPPEVPPPVKPPEKKEVNRGSLVVGVILIIAGLFFFFGQIFNLWNWEVLWPMFIIGVGIAFFVGMIAGGKSLSGLAIPGSIISMIGLILLIQSTFNIWEAWSYAWALIIVAVGIGQVISGYWSENSEERRKGWETARVGLILFLIFGAIFGIIFALTGVTRQDTLVFWAIALAAVGVYLLVSRIVRLGWKKEKVTKDDRDLFWPIIFIGVGVFAILVKTGWLGTPQWNAILSLWPLLIIFAGLQLIFGRRTAWLSAILAVILLGAIYAVGFAGDKLGIRSDSSFILFPGLNRSLNWGSGQVIKGSGTISEETRPIEGVTKVNFSSFGTLEIQQGETESLVVRADDNLLTYIETGVNGNKLTIDTKSGYNLRPTQTIHYVLTVKNLEEFLLSGAGEVVTSSLEGKELEINASGAGKFELNGLTLNDLRVSISGAGSVFAEGTTGTLDVNISGAGSFKSEDLQSGKAAVRISGTGNAVVWVTDALDARIPGLGSISYWGNPELTKNVSGLGTVRNLGDK